jgi:hypothetical protein
VSLVLSLVGTTQQSRWQWSRANKNIPPHSKLATDEVRDVGEANGRERLTTPFLVADDYSGWKMRAMAEQFLDAMVASRFPTDYGICDYGFRTIGSVGANEETTSNPV